VLQELQTWFEGRMAGLDSLEYYAERRLRDLGLVDDTGSMTPWVLCFLFALSCLLGCLQARRPLIPVYRLRGQAYCIQFTFDPRDKPQVKQCTILLSISRSQRFWVIVVYSKYSCAYLFVCCLYILCEFQVFNE